MHENSALLVGRCNTRGKCLKNYPVLWQNMHTKVFLISPYKKWLQRCKLFVDARLTTEWDVVTQKCKYLQNHEKIIAFLQQEKNHSQISTSYMTSSRKLAWLKSRKIAIGSLKSEQPLLLRLQYRPGLFHHEDLAIEYLFDVCIVIV